MSDSCSGCTANVADDDVREKPVGLDADAVLGDSGLHIHAMAAAAPKTNACARRIALCREDDIAKTQNKHAVPASCAPMSVSADWRRFSTVLWAAEDVEERLARAKTTAAPARCILALAGGRRRSLPLTANDIVNAIVASIATIAVFLPLMVLTTAVAGSAPIRCPR